MRILLDECLPRRLGRELSDHDVVTVQQAGWSGVKNGELLRRIAGQFDAFITIDRSLPNQQQMVGLAFGVILLRAPSNSLVILKPMAPSILKALAEIDRGQIVIIDETSA